MISSLLIENEKQIYPSIEFYEFYKWIKASPYYTDNVEESCIRIPSLDLLSYYKIQKYEKQIGEYLQNRTSWNDGLNNVIFNFYPPMSTLNGMATGFDSIPSGKSLIASSSLRHSTVRYGMDVPIPYYSKMVDIFVNKFDSNTKRPLDLLILGDLRSDVQFSLEKFLISSQSSKYVILKLKNCDSSNYFDLKRPICDQVLYSMLC